MNLSTGDFASPVNGIYYFEFFGLAKNTVQILQKVKNADSLTLENAAFLGADLSAFING